MERVGRKDTFRKIQQSTMHVQLKARNSWSHILSQKPQKLNEPTIRQMKKGQLKKIVPVCHHHVESAVHDTHHTVHHAWAAALACAPHPP
jgi:hypothetical protein